MKPYGMIKRDFTLKSAIKYRHRNGYDDMVNEDPPSNKEKCISREEIISQLNELENVNAVVDQKGI